MELETGIRLQPNPSNLLARFYFSTVKVVPYPIRDSNPQPQDYFDAYNECLEVLRSIQLSQSGQVFLFFDNRRVRTCAAIRQ